MKPKVLIEIDGGNLSFVGANQDMDIIIVDWDNIEQGDEPCLIPPNKITDDLSEIYNNFKDNSIQERIYKSVKYLTK